MLRYKKFRDNVKKKVKGSITEGNYFLLVIDVLKFHVFNEIYGIQQANEVLYSIEAALDKDTNVVAWDRLYADHFVFLIHLEEKCDEVQIREKYKNLVSAFLEPLQKKYTDCPLELSGGIYVMTDDDYVFAIDAANQARKASKELLGENVVVYRYSDIEASVFDAKKVSRLNHAMDEGKFTFYLQSKVDLKTGKIIGAEALVRLIEDDGTVVFPGDFLNIMESNGTIVKLDYIIYEQVCKHLSERIRQKKKIVPISVNLSALHFTDKDTAQKLDDIAKKYNVPSEYIEFELTETALAESIGEVKKFINDVREIGYSVSVDDFGSGYAGINLWREYDVDTVKLDRSFLSEKDDVKMRNHAIVPNIINTSHRLNSNVLCEGVETFEQCTWLIGLGCVMAQGYYFSKPVTREAFYEYFDKKDYYDLEYMVAENIADQKVEAKPKVPWTNQVVALIASFVMLIGAFYVVSDYENNRKSDYFAEGVKENLESFSVSQKIRIDSTIEGVKNTLSTVADLASQRGGRNDIEPYVEMLNINQDNEGITYVYNTIDYLVGENKRFNDDTYEKLLNGEFVMSSIVPSYTDGGEYWFGISYPVFENGNLHGTLSAIIRAKVLTEIDELHLSYGKVHCVMICDGEDRILYSTCKDENVYQVDMIKHITESLSLSFDDEALENLLNTENGFAAFRDVNGRNMYVTMSNLPYNDWNLVVLYESEFAHAYSEQMGSLSQKVWTVMIAVIIVLMIFIIWVFHRESKKRVEERSRYMLIEQFSDTVLFSYECATDTVVFTNNTKKHFDLSWADNNKYTGFLKNISSTGFIYSADHSTLHSLLSGVGGEDESCRVRVKAIDGKYVWCQLQYKYMYINGKLSSVVGKLVNVDKQYQREQELYELASNDTMTMLLNKTTATQRISNRLEEGKKGSLLVVDVDKLKEINDVHGHGKGDNAIRFVAESLREVFGEGDIIGRIGGDEFLVWTEKYHDSKLVVGKIEELFDVLSKYADKTTISVGVAVNDGEKYSFEDLFKSADEAMYVAKKQGRNTHRIAE